MTELLVATATGLATKATESAYDSLKQQISYAFKCQNHINHLKKQVEDLRNKKERVEVSVEKAERQGEEIYKDVKTWLSDVAEFTEGVAKAVTEDEDKANKGGCFKFGSCPNLIQRYKLGKAAVEAAVTGADLLGKCNFSGFSYRSALQMTKSMDNGDDEAFHSREQALQQIIEALQDINVNRIGVYGMGGVGKTTLVKKVAGQVKENKLFQEVATAEVTQTPDYKKIQEKLAFHLGLEFGQEESEYQRADRLRYRIKKAKNLLIILDNIWTKVDLDAIGIPLEDATKERKDDKVRPCTMLLTSRNRDLLSKDMKTQKDILICPLSDGDAGNLFWKIVGDSAESSDRRSVGNEIITKCAGLPLAISTIANALKKEGLHAWKCALAELKRSNPRHILDMDETLYSTLELSYNFLKSVEAKSLFLLCALIDRPGDSASLDDLLKYSVGWNLFGDVYTLEEGRDKLRTSIDRLKASSLLMDGDYGDSVKMHDVIHAVAVSIASEKLMFNIQNVTGFGEKISKHSTAISLPYIDICDELPERLGSSKLEFFYLFTKNLSLQIPDTFFEETKELRVLDLTGFKFSSLPSSISFLKNLQTLCLDSCQLGDIKIVGELRKVEILSLLRSDIEQLPAEIGQLTRLKLLDLSNCSNLKYIAPNVISCLSQLEELYMGNSFDHWEVEGMDHQGRRNASLGELKRLSNLTALHLHIQDARLMPQDLFFEKLKSYKIFIGHKRKWSRKYDLSTSRLFKLKKSESVYLGQGIKSLLGMTEDLSLTELRGVRYILFELDVNGFSHLKCLHVKESPDILYIVNSVVWKLAFPRLESLILCNLIKLEKICHGQLNVGSFSKLRIIKTEKCDRLEFLFASFMTKNLMQLQKVEVTDCKKLKEIFGEESNDHGDEIEANDGILFNQLYSLTLQRLPKFIKISSDTKVVFPRLENLNLCSINFENTLLEQRLSMFSYCHCLKSLTVEECNGLKFLFSSLMVKSLNQLQKLVVRDCDSMEVIIDSRGVGEEKTIDMSFPSLKELHIEQCSNLKTFFNQSFYPDMMRKELKEELNSNNNFIDIIPLFNDKVSFPSLEEMVLLHLDNLRLIWHNQKLHLESFCKLKVVRVESCEKLVTIVPPNTQGHIIFQNLETLTVMSCWSVKSLFPVSTAIGLLQLKELQIISCGLEKIVYEENANVAPTFLFPKLTYIHLRNLLELKCFYPGLHAIEWPMLRRLHVYGCKKIKVYASELPSFQAREGEWQPAPFLLEKVMPNLEGLGLDAHNFRSTFLCSDLVESFGKLKRLCLTNFDDGLVASLFDFLQKLNCLESLVFRGSSFKELFPYEQGHIRKQDFQGDTFLQNLQGLHVHACPCLTILMPFTPSFKNLETLEAWNCDRLAKVLTCEAAKTLVNVKAIIISECKLVTEVIANEGDKEEETVFVQLQVLKLNCLSSLTSFCSANYSFKFPRLELVIVIQCPKLNIFSQGKLSTPLLKTVQLTKGDDDQKYLWKDDLNSTIQQMFMDMIGFRNMEYLKLSEFPTLKEKIWNDQLSASVFFNLKWLVLDEVFNMSSLFPSHVFYHFKNLETLEVRDCHSLKDLFDIEGQTLKNREEEILGLNKLKSLKVHNCGSLRYIFTPPIILGVDQLREIEVKDCDLIEEIITKDEGSKAAIDRIFIPELKSIVLEALPNLANFYSGTDDLACPSLKSISIAKCPQIETFVFTDLREKDYSEHTAALFSEKVAFPRLEEMVLLHLDNLQLIWHNQKLHAESFHKLKVVRVESCEKLLTIVPSSTQGNLTFHNLERLTVENCWSMKSLFPVSTAISLVQLKALRICFCGLETIVYEENVNMAPTFLFPKLKFIHLKYLLELKCFYPRLHAIEWPMLRSLGVYGCKRIKVYASEFSSFQAREREWQPALFLLEKVIPNLEVMGLDAHDFKLTFLYSDLAKSFGKLKTLSLGNFDDGSVASLFDFLQKLNCLESLCFSGNSFKELFPYEQGSIRKQDFQGGTFLQNLRTLQVRYCYCLTILMPSGPSLKNLRTLEACNCDGLAKVLTCEAAKSLVNLTKLTIRDCKLVTEVIVNEGDRGEEIVFGQLKVLELYRLSSLSFFCSANYSLNFPCLEQLIVNQCPKLYTFSQGVLSTPLLQKVRLKQEDEGQDYFCKDDLNSTIQQMFADAVGFRDFKHLTLSEFSNFKEKIWNDQLPIDIFWNLKSLVLDKFSDISSGIPPNVLCHFKNLEMLDVKSCESLEQVFDLEENQEEILGLQKLKSLKIENCNSLRFVFTPSVLRVLVQLQEIKVKNCALIEEIIKKEGEKDGVSDKIIIPRLNSVKLESLPNLTSFYSGINVFECPPLQTIIFKDCQKIHMKQFSIHLASLFTVKVVLPSSETSCFQNLSVLVVDGFEHLKYLFPSSVVKSLFRLQKLKISDCKFMERVIDEDGERSSALLFPKLYQLKLRDLPKLTTFCTSTSNCVELSALFRLWIENCPGIRTFISSSVCCDMTLSSKEPEGMSSKENSTHMQSLFDKKVRLPSLERLQISHAYQLVKIWDDQVLLDSFCKLNRVFLYFCKRLVSVFPSNMLGSHQKLEFLEVQNCDSIEEIFEVLEKSSCMVEKMVTKEEALPRFVFSKLTELNLQMLPSFKSFYPEIHISEWPVLEVLKVHGCNNVEIFASELLSIQGSYGQQTLFFVHKDAFPSLEELELCEMPRLLHLWRGNYQHNDTFRNLKTLKVSECGNLENSWSSPLSFWNLETLQVSKCDKLRYLLTLSKAKTLDRLTRMNVSDCKMMEEIISHSGDEVIENSIVFSNLDCLELHCLCSLKSFCCGGYSLEFPFLKKVIVRKCLEMETFCHGVLSTPKLEKLQLTGGEDEVEECWEGNLNSTIQYLFKDMNVRSSKEN